MSGRREKRTFIARWAKYMSKQKPFEENLKELEGCVTQMEDNELPLSEALALYKKGMELINFCNIELKNVQQQIQVYDKKTNSLIDVNPESVIGPRNKKS